VSYTDFRNTNLTQLAFHELIMTTFKEGRENERKRKRKK
jgi:hypothetical protein